MPLQESLAALWRRIVTPGRVILHDVKLAITPALDIETRRQLRRGVYQQAKVRQLASKIEPNDSYLDVGAGLGFTSLYAAAIVGDANVVAVEADPRAVELARANFARNDRSIHLVEAAATTQEAAAEDGTVAFYPNTALGASACFPRAGGTEPIRVPRADLAALLAEREVTALNVDAAGCECDILAALDDFHALRVLLVTIHEQASGYERTVALVRHLLEHRFALDFADSDGQQVVFVRRP